MTSVSDPDVRSSKPLPAVDLDALVIAAHGRYREHHPNSESAHTRARRVMPGGNTRTVLDFDPFPFRVVRADGPFLVDIDQHRYVDFCGNYTAGLLGHSPESVKDAIVDALAGGWALGATHEREIRLAELVCDRFHSIDQVRFTNSGTEANLMAIGTALHHSGRSTVGVFHNAYHGGVLSFGAVEGPHHPLNVPHRFRVAPFDDIAGLDQLFADLDLGCVLIEPVQGSAGCLPAAPSFLAELRRRCTATGVVLIFDEVMTSRLAAGGAQERLGVRPDMTTLGKYIGGGMTFGAFGGRSDIMAHFDKSSGGQLTQAGTFNNNVVSMSAAIAALSGELHPDRIDEVNDRGDRLRRDLDRVLAARGLPMWATGMGSMVGLHSSEDRLMELMFHAALADGLYLARRGFIALSMVVTEDHCDALVASVDRWAESLRTA
ncbi:MAG: aminotransferase class III-fold pyridoxal phosphate-dependent enzyme [Acidimicrobiales bacterium]|nr:aminotransferase class III-fold pyridoxal phosphate-dependent enzyme [Acidimicrobiales bacterium]